MNTTDTTEQQMIRDAILDITSNYGPEYWDTVRDEHRFPSEIYEELAEGGWLGVNIPEEYGGQGMGLSELVTILETMGEGGAWEGTISYIVSLVFGGEPVLSHGTEEQKKKYLPPIINGEDTWALGITEPDAGLNTSNISTFAESDGDGFIIDGKKQWISGMDTASQFLLLARTTPPTEIESPLGGLTMFIVDPDDPAIEYNEIPLDSYFPEKTYEVFIDDLYVPKSDVLGEVDDGLKQIFQTINAERITTAAAVWAAGKHSLNKAVEYAQNREVWSEPIGAHQGIQHPLADAYADLESARYTIEKAAWAYDEETANNDVATLSNIANLQAGKAAWKACEATMTTFGGMSASQELGIAAAWSFVRHLRIIPVSEEMIWNYIGQNVLDLPRSY